MSDLHLYVYDLSKGMAKAFSAMFLGKHFDGVWHTGVVAFGREWYFGNDGIDSCLPKATVLGEPNEIINLGKTELNEQDFHEVINQMRDSSYKFGSYNLLDHNCNNFSNDLALLLVGKPIPAHIIDLPREIMNTPLGPMLRPLLEQAADPLHQYRSGNTPMFAQPPSFLTGLNQNVNSNALASSKVEKTIERIPSTVVLFKPDVANEIDLLVLYCETEKLLNSNEFALLSQVKNLMEKNENISSITNSHVKLLFDLYFNLVKKVEHNITILNIFQALSLNKTSSKIILDENLFKNVFIAHLNDASVAPDQKLLSLKMLNNLCSHESISVEMLEKHQDLLFKELSDFTLMEVVTDIDVLIHETSISFFYNLVSAYHLENFLNDSNALALGCALLERLPKLRSKPNTIYHMLSLLRSCLSNSQNMRDLALSMDFDLAKYANNLNETDKKELPIGESKSESYESIVKNIDDLMHANKN